MAERHHLPDRESGFGGQQPKAVQRALAMLEAVAYLGAGATAQQISAHTRVPPATAYRLLNLLVADGFLVRTPDLSGFALGRRTTELAYAAAAAEPVRTVADVLAGLRAQTRHGLYWPRSAAAHCAWSTPVRAGRRRADLGRQFRAGRNSCGAVRRSCAG